MDLKPIRSEEDYENALLEIERLFDAEPGTPEEDKLEVLALLVEDYEKKYFTINLPDPIEAIKYHMERLGLTRKDLFPFIGLESRISEILNRKRRLTLPMIRKLSKGLGISIEVLAQEYELDRYVSVVTIEDEFTAQFMIAVETVYTLFERTSNYDFEPMVISMGEAANNPIHLKNLRMSNASFNDDADQQISAGTATIMFSDRSFYKNSLASDDMKVM